MYVCADLNAGTSIVYMNPCDKLYYVAQCLQKNIGMFKEKGEFLHTCRMQLDYYVFEYLKEEYGSALDTFWETYTIPKTSDKAIVFVERRCHPNLEFCLKNAVYFARGYSVHIFCSESNIDFIKYICGSQEDNIHFHIQFKGIGTPEEGKLEYNALLKQRQFWETFTEEHILTFETDCYLRKPIPDSIYSYDYVASKWPWLPNDPGGGGLSYRKCSVMLKICDIDNKEITCIPMQDTFVSDAIKVFQLKTPTFEESIHYFCEAVSIESTAIGVHQWWTFFIKENVPIHFGSFKDYLLLEIV